MPVCQLQDLVSSEITPYNICSYKIPGYLYCDTPADLALSSFTSMPSFFEMSNISFSIFTGDIVSHDNDDQVSSVLWM